MLKNDLRVDPCPNLSNFREVLLDDLGNANAHLVAISYGRCYGMEWSCQLARPDGFAWVVITRNALADHAAKLCTSVVIESGSTTSKLISYTQAISIIKGW